MCRQIFKNLTIIAAVMLVSIAPIAIYPSWAQVGSASSTVPQKRWGIAHYRVPVGWAETDSGSTRIFTPKGADKNTAMILLVQGPEAQGDFRAGFDKAIANVTRDKTVVKTTDVGSSKTSEGYDVLSQMIVTEEKSGSMRVLTQVMAIQTPKQIWITAFVGTSQEACEKYGPAFVTFMANLDFDKLARAVSPTSSPALTTDHRPPTTSLPNATWNPDAAAATRSEATRRVANHVRGKIYDASGKPFHIGGARPNIHIWGASAAGERVFFDTQADANGVYDLKVPHGLYVVGCWVTLPLGGSDVRVNLEQMDDKPTQITEDSTPGIVKDFYYKPVGSVKGGNPGSFAGYHGGGVYVTDGANWKESYFGSMTRKFPAGTQTEVTLTPLSARIDGIPAKPMVFLCTLENMQTGATQASIPLAVYRVTARLVQPDGKRIPLRVALLPNLNYADTVEIRFTPDNGDPDHRPTIPNIFVSE